jgi:hypothetical protein
VDVWLPKNIPKIFKTGQFKHETHQISFAKTSEFSPDSLIFAAQNHSLG